MSDARREIVALDVGGTAVKSGVLLGDPAEVARVLARDPVRASEVLAHLEREAIDSAAGREAIVARLAEICDRQTARCARPEVIAIGFPGPCDYERGIPLLRGLGKFDALHGLDLGARLAERLAHPLPITFVNDASAAAVGEALARDLEGRALMITLGTGFGTAFLDGKAIDGRTFPWSATGELFAEPAFGGRADDAFSIRGLDLRLADRGVDCAGLAARPGAIDADAALRERFHRFGVDLGGWLVPYARTAGVGLVIVGGGLAAHFPRFGPAMARALGLPVEPARLGDAAALVGAADHAARRLAEPG